MHNIALRTHFTEKTAAICSTFAVRLVVARLAPEVQTAKSTPIDSEFEHRVLYLIGDLEAWPGPCRQASKLDLKTKFPNKNNPRTSRFETPASSKLECSEGASQ